MPCRCGKTVRCLLPGCSSHICPVLCAGLPVLPLITERCAAGHDLKRCLLSRRNRNSFRLCRDGRLCCNNGQCYSLTVNCSSRIFHSAPVLIAVMPCLRDEGIRCCLSAGRLDCGPVAAGILPVIPLVSEPFSGCCYCKGDLASGLYSHPLGWVLITGCSGELIVKYFVTVPE